MTNAMFDYDLNNLAIITPKKRNFKMFVTQRLSGRYADRSYEEYTCDLLLKYVRDGSVFIDIGAHYGYYTLLIGSQKPNCRILSFEPVPENIEILKKNIALNNLTNVEIHQAAVSSRTGTQSLHITEASDNCGFYRHPLSAVIKEISVETVRLDSYLNDVGNRDVCIKIDTEGHELYVLEGMEAFLRDRENVKMVIEFNPKCIAVAGYKPDDLLNKINDMGFDIYFILDDKRLFYKLDPLAIDKWRECMQGYEESYLNILCIKKDKSLNISFFSHSSNLVGAERSLLELIRELIEDHGTLVSVISPDEGPLNAELRKLGAAVIIAGYCSWYDLKTVPYPSDTTLKISVSSLMNILVDILGKINPDILVTNTLAIPWGALAATMLSKPHAWFIREIGPQESTYNYYVPFEHMLTIVSATSNVIFTNSNVVKSSMFAETNNVIPAYTHFEIPLEEMKAGGGEIFSRTDSTKLMVVGTVMELKGQIDAVLAVKELVRRGKDVELAVVGPMAQDYAGTLNDVIHKANLHGQIKMPGWTDKPFWAMNQADIILVCSRFESFGRAAAEAMLLGKPVIGSNNTGTAELIRDGFNGLLYETGDHLQLADRIEYLIDHKEKIEEFGHNGRVYAEKTFSKQNFGDKIYDKLKALKNCDNPIDSAYISFIMRLMAIAIKQPSTVREESNAVKAGLNAAAKGRLNHYYQLCLQGIHIISNEGWKPFLNKSKAFLGRSSLNRYNR
ncbi:MAG: FkbM family methyltransferase [Dehalococcoidia bacterium]